MTEATTKGPAPLGRVSPDCAQLALPPSHNLSESGSDWKAEFDVEASELHLHYALMSTWRALMRPTAPQLMR
jgi:hypothetical protein